jgi:hypothetical protein
LHGHKLQSFSAEPCSKNAEKSTIVLWITAREQNIPTSHNPNQNMTALGKKGFYTNHDPNKQDSF